MLDEPGYKLGEERRKKYGITNADLLDPQTNAAVALDIMRTQGRSAWSTDDMVTPEQLEMAAYLMENFPEEEFLYPKQKEPSYK